MRVIGTAGHVDHGKSTLVQALTGTHPDRLKEEREREMTIDLGFAFLTLPDGEEVGIIDVPGHRDFIENMLAGVGGIDAALFVIAADEGVMVQTREHLAILDLLNINGGVIALTKVDMVSDPGWLELVEEDIRKVIAGTVLAEAPIIRVSARQNLGLQALIQALTVCLKDRPPRPDVGRPRLPVDRVFSVAGFGTIVTGTLLDGSFQVGEEIVVLPSERRGRIRGLQTHNQDIRSIPPGSRTAVNISGLDVVEVPRGSWLAKPGQYAITRRLDARIKLLPDVKQPAHHNMEVKFFLGTAEVVGTLRLIGKEELKPGETGWAQLELREPVLAVRNDRFILRRPSPAETLGGGVIVEPLANRRYRRSDSAVIGKLEMLERGSPSELLFQAIQQSNLAMFKDVLNQVEFSLATAQELWRELSEQGMAVCLDSDTETPKPDSWICSRVNLDQLIQKFQGNLAAYHQAFPLRRGMSREELKRKMKMESRAFSTLVNFLVQNSSVETDGPRLWLATHQVRFTPAQDDAIRALRQQLAAAPYAPPTIKEIQASVGGEVYTALVEQGELVPVSTEVVFSREAYDFLVKQVKEIIRTTGGISVADFRDRFNTTRKYALALLEHLDVIGVTLRQGDSRVLKER